MNPAKNHTNSTGSRVKLGCFSNTTLLWHKSLRASKNMSHEGKKRKLNRNCPKFVKRTQYAARNSHVDGAQEEGVVESLEKIRWANHFYVKRNARSLLLGPKINKENRKTQIPSWDFLKFQGESHIRPSRSRRAWLPVSLHSNAKGIDRHSQTHEQ